MATNEFKVFDENNQNVLTDAEYANNPQRLNGVVGGIADSKVHNKLFKQTSIMTTALGAVIADAGLNASDKDVNQLKTNLQKAFGSQKVYYSLSDVNPLYNQNTPLRTVMTAMVLHSELHANVTASTADYPAAGTLHITKTVDNTASMVFDSATDKYYANVTPTNIEQIFGGGGKIWKLLIDDLELTTLENEMANVKKSVADGKGLVAGAISAKGIATTGTDTFATMAGNVDKIITLGQGTGDGTAIANQILSGLVAYAKGKRLIGTMADNGAVSKSLAINSTYTIPAGYHNGSGKVTQSITTKAAQTYTPTTANQTIGAGQYLNGAQTIAGSGNLVAGNIKQGVNIFGVVGNVVMFNKTFGQTIISPTFNYSSSGSRETFPISLPSGNFKIYAAQYTVTLKIQSGGTIFTKSGQIKFDSSAGLTMPGLRETIQLFLHSSGSGLWYDITLDATETQINLKVYAAGSYAPCSLTIQICLCYIS